MKYLVVFFLTALLVCSNSYGQEENTLGYFGSIDEMKSYIEENGDFLTGLQLWDFKDFDQIKDFVDVSKITVLKISSSKVDDIRFVAGFKNLEELEIEGKLNVLDLQFIPENTQRLSLSHPKTIEGIDLAGTKLAEVIEVKLSGRWDCEIVYSLLSNTAVDTLALRSVDLTGYNCFEESLSVRSLSLQSCKIREVGDVASVINVQVLESLSVNGSRLARLNFDPPFQSLKNVKIRHCKVKVVNGLENLKGVIFLDLSENKLKELLVDLPRLQYLNVSNNKLKKVTLLNTDSILAVDVSHNNLGLIEGFNQVEERVRAFYFCDNPEIRLNDSIYFANIVSVTIDTSTLDISLDTSGLKIIYGCAREGDKKIYFDKEDVQYLSPRHFRQRDIHKILNSAILR